MVPILYGSSGLLLRSASESGVVSCRYGISESGLAEIHHRSRDRRAVGSSDSHVPRRRSGDSRGGIGERSVLVPGYGFSFHVHRHAQYVARGERRERGNRSRNVRSVRAAVRIAAEMGRA